MEPRRNLDSTKQVEQVTAKHLGARKEGSNLYESLIGYVTRAGQLGAFPKPATLVAVPHTLPGDQSGGQLEEGESADPVPRRFEMQRGRSYRSNFLNVSNSTAEPVDRRRETGIDLDAPDDPVLYMAWLRRKRGLVGRGRRVSSESGYCDEDRKLVLGHLGYRGQISRQFGRFSSDPLSMIRYQPRPGIIVSLYGTLQRHGQLEYSNLEREIFDADGMFDAGEVIWVNSGQASAVVKDMATGTHSEVEEVYGVSTRGFLLFTLPGLTEPVWTWPREPEEAGGRDRPFYYETGRTENDVSGIVLESFTLAAGLLESYRDLSGITVPVLPVKRSTLSHRDHLAPTANVAHRP